jgi:hypothetical protein
MGMEFGKNVFIADDFSQIPRTDLTRRTAARRIHTTPSEEGGYGRILAAGLSAGIILLISRFLVFLEAFGGIHNAGCDATECAPDDGACAERSSGISSG